ncbi:MAG: hypothetical protein Kow0056_06880 [Coriobacteriia bacterium]
MLAVCGIAGIVIRDGQEDEAYEAFERALHIQCHRGPDDADMRSLDRCLLGHCRLSIIDIAGGHQPMTTEDGSLWLVFNGEIYNYLELRTQLSGKGHILATDSDSEVILHVFEEWGTECVAHFNGMWAFTIWDTTRSHVRPFRGRFTMKIATVWRFR